MPTLPGGTRSLRALAALAGAGALATVAAVAPSTADDDTPSVRAADPDSQVAVEPVPDDEVVTSSPLSDRLLIAASADEVKPAPEPEPQDDTVAAEAAPAEPAPDPEPARSVWDRLADCESGSWTGDGGFVEASANWSATAGMFEGGLQFHPNTWDAYKDPGMPGAAYEASRGQQIAVAERVLAEQGWKAWPTCSRKLGLR